MLFLLPIVAHAQVFSESKEAIIVDLTEMSEMKNLSFQDASNSLNKYYILREQSGNWITITGVNEAASILTDDEYKKTVSKLPITLSDIDRTSLISVLIDKYKLTGSSSVVYCLIREKDKYKLFKASVYLGGLEEM